MPDEQLDNRPTPHGAEHLRPWMFVKGVSGNPSGRPKGSISLKQWARNYIQTLSDEEKLEFLEGMNKKDVWEMAEGKPDTKTDVTSDGKPVPILQLNVLRDNSNEENN